MFDGHKITQEMLNLSKNSWLTTMEMMTGWHKQNEQMWNTMMEQGVVTQKEGRNMVQEWHNLAKQIHEQYNRSMEDAWEKAETVFGATPKTGK